jgi:hypothetical protein
MNSHDRREIAWLVAWYCSHERHPALPAFTIHPYTRENCSESPEWQKPGCYIGYDADGILRYIGQASLNSTGQPTKIGNRVYKHFRILASHFNKRGVQYLDLIPTRAFEALSLEAYLQVNMPGYFDEKAGRFKNHFIPPPQNAYRYWQATNLPHWDLPRDHV